LITIDSKKVIRIGEQERIAPVNRMQGRTAASGVKPVSSPSAFGPVLRGAFSRAFRYPVARPAETAPASNIHR
jgi:hypothetical protein